MVQPHECRYIDLLSTSWLHGDIFHNGAYATADHHCRPTCAPRARGFVVRALEGRHGSHSWLVKSRIDIPEDDQPARGRSLPQGSTQAQCLSGAQGVERIGFPLREGRRIFYGCPPRLDRAGSVSRHRGPACCPGRLGSRRPRRIPRWELCPRQSEALV